MRIQVTLTVPEGKRLIAKGIAARTDVKKAFRHGKILLKGEPQFRLYVRNLVVNLSGFPEE